MNERFTYMSEAQLTKNSTNRTLGRDLKNSMDNVDIETANIANELSGIIKQREEGGVTADEAQSARSVWEAALGRELTPDETWRAVLGVHNRDNGGVDPVIEQQITIMEKVVANPGKFDEISDTIRHLGPESIKNSLKGHTGRIIIAMLADGSSDVSQYFRRLDEVVLSSDELVEENIQKLIEDIRKDVVLQQELDIKEQREDSLRVETRTASGEAMGKAQKAWDVENERAMLEGREITKEDLDGQAYAVRNGLGPMRGGENNGDKLFENLDFMKYGNRELRALAFSLKKEGEQDNITQQTINGIKTRILNLVVDSKITEVEHDEFLDELDHKLEEWNAKQPKKEEKRHQNRAHQNSAAENHSYNDNHAHSLFDNAQGSVEGIADMDSDSFAGFKESFGENYEQVIAGIEQKFGNNEERVSAFKNEWNQIMSQADPRRFNFEVRSFIKRLKESSGIELDESGNPKEKKKTKIQYNNVMAKGIEEGWLSERMFQNEPRSIEDLARWIIVQDDSRLWSPYSKQGHPLFELIHDEDDQGVILRDENGNPKFDDEGEVRKSYETTELKFRPENLIRWLRNKMVELHNDNADDPMQPLERVGIRTVYSTVSIIQMKYDKQRYFSDPRTGEIMDKLYNQVIDEAWLFGVRRNYDLAYRQAMNSDEKLVDIIVAINSKNEHTKGNFLQTITSLPDNFSMEDGEGDTKVGEALLFGSQIYKNIVDSENLAKLIDDSNSPLFTMEGFENAVRILEGKGKWYKPDSFGNLEFERNSRGELERIISVNASTGEPRVLIEGKNINMKSLLEYYNIFTSPNELDTNVRVVRELVKSAIAKEFKFDTGIDFPPSEEEWIEMQVKAKNDKRHVSIKFFRDAKRINLEFAEINAYIEQRWNGQASRNDTGFRGFDAGTKTQHVQKYRERQSNEDTSGPIGNRYDIPIFRNLTPEMWVAIKTEKGVVTQRIFEQIIEKGKQIRRLGLGEENNAHRKRLEAEKDDLYNSLRFPQGTQLDWASNQVKRGWEVWHAILQTEDLGFDKLVTTNMWGDPQYNDGEFQKVIRDEFIKKRRYAFSSNNSIDYGSMTRVFTGEKNVDGTWKFVDKRVAEAMFGNIVTEPLRSDWDEGNLKYEKYDPISKSLKVFDCTNGGSYGEYLSSQEARKRLFKNATRAGIAAQIKAHRENHGTTAKWNRSVVNNLINSLKTLQAVKEGEDGKEEFLRDKDTGKILSFFTKKDLDWIRKQAGVEDWKLILEESGLTAAEMLAGFPGLFSALTNGLVDI